MTRRASDLEARLTEWGKEYGGGKYEDIGWQGKSPLASMMKWHGRPPDGLGYEAVFTAADEVDEAVRALALQPEGRLPAVVVTLEYWLPGQPIEAKQQKLRGIGDNVGRVRYYQHLRTARIHIAGWLHIAFSEDDAVKVIAKAIREGVV
jgi:hypothetical protein